VTTVSELAEPKPPVPAAPMAGERDPRGSIIPTAGMIAAKLLELRKRRGLMIALVLVDIGIPTIFLVVRLLAHAFDPKTYGPAGGYTIYSDLVAGVMYIFGFIVAATLGCTAGSADLGEGMFRHLVVTGRSRLAIYFARIPAGLAIVVPMVAVGFTIVCAVCVFAAPKTVNYDGINVPAGLSRGGLESWAADHADEIVCNLGYGGPGPGGSNIACGPNGPVLPASGATPARSAVRAFAVQVADQNFAAYHDQFRFPSDWLMVRSGLWLELEAGIGFLVGLGLASFLGQRTVSVVLMIVLEIILTPLFSMSRISHLINLQRAIVGVATAHLEPGGLPGPFRGGNGPNATQLISETRLESIAVVIIWLIVWTALGAWRMATRDA
jgi:hypothetical protein